MAKCRAIRLGNEQRGKKGCVAVPAPAETGVKGNPWRGGGNPQCLVGRAANSRRAPQVHISEQSTFCETHHSGAGDYEMVQYSHVNQGKRLFQRLGQRLVGVARLANA